MQIIDDKVIFSLKNWKELKKDPYFKEVLELLEDREELLESIETESEFFPIEEVDREIRAN